MIGVWIWLPGFGPIRTSTVVVGVLVFGVVTLKLDVLRGWATVVAWASAFEILYHVVGIIGYQWPLANFVWMTGALAGWIVLAAVLGIWPDWRISVIFVALMGAWVATGFHYNVPGQSTPVNIEDEILNEAAKSTLALAYLVGALRSTSETQRTQRNAGFDHSHVVDRRGHAHQPEAQANEPRAL